MEPKNTRALNIISGLVTPFLIETLFVVWLKESRDVHPPVAMEYAMLVVSSGVGALFLARAFRGLGLLIAVAYFLVMPFVMFFFGFFLVGAIYGDFL